MISHIKEVIDLDRKRFPLPSSKSRTVLRMVLVVDWIGRHEKNRVEANSRARDPSIRRVLFIVSLLFDDSTGEHAGR
jgi:hypothetical protein